MLRFIVQAVESRRSHVEGYLARHIPGLEIAWSDGTKPANLDTRLTLVKGLRMAGRDPVVWLQDDVVLCKHFALLSAQVAAEHPRDVVKLFSRRSLDLANGEGWRPTRDWINNQGFILPAGAAEAVADSMDAQPRETWVCDDIDLPPALVATGFPRYWQTVPSLVDHAGMVSVVDHRRARARLAKWFDNLETEGLAPTSEHPQ